MQVVKCCMSSRFCCTSKQWCIARQPQRANVQVFERFLLGDTLEECYEAVAEVANRWLDMLDTQVKFSPCRRSKVPCDRLLQWSWFVSVAVQQAFAEIPTCVCDPRLSMPVSSRSSTQYHEYCIQASPIHLKHHVLTPALLQC